MCVRTQATVGLVSKPVAGLATLVSKVSEGAANSVKSAARSLQGSGGGRRTTTLQHRARQPRHIEPGGALLPYPPAPALGSHESHL